MTASASGLITTGDPSSSLVARLRRGEACADTGYACNVRDAKSGCLCAEAADEIERLQAKIKQMEEDAEDAKIDRRLDDIP